MSLSQDQVLMPLLAVARGDLLTLSVPAVCVAADRSCQDVDLVFRRDPHLTSVAVRDGDRVGLLMRSRLAQTMTGPLGYGRLLNASRPVSVVTSWSPLMVPAGTGVVDAATMVVLRSDDRWDDVLVQTGEGLRVAGASVVMQGLAGAFAARATQDDLTGLPNRSMFYAQLGEACAQDGTHPGASVAMLYIDLDGFKAINDAHGHNAGDAALVAAAARLRSVARANDVIARLGGDEFAVLLQSAHLDSAGVHDGSAQVAARVGERYRAALAAGDGALRASVGVAIGSLGTASAEILLHEADLAMYSAKAAGGNRVVVVDRVGDHLTLAADGQLAPDPDAALRDAFTRAIREEQMVLHYQPIVRLSDHLIVSVEALVRWAHPQRGLLSPGAFLADAERFGLMAELDAWVIGHALADYATWRRTGIQGLPRYLNVNLSRASLARPDLYETVIDALHRHGVPATHLRLELVEDAETELLAAAAPQLNALREDGVSLTWDDMGSGASSLMHITQLAVDDLKIDGTFIQDINATPSALAVVRMLVHLGAGLGLTVTAEGVETAEQLTTLTNLGAGYAQGYHLARPAPKDQIIAVLARGVAGNSLPPPGTPHNQRPNRHPHPVTASFEAVPSFPRHPTRRYR